MLNLILLVQTPQDVADLPGCIPVLKRLPLHACWLIYSPAVVVDVAAAHLEIDQQIAARNGAIDEAWKRRDFDGAKAHDLEIQGLTIRKAALATEGVKASTPEQRAAMADKIFGNFYDQLKAPQIPNLEITEHTQHFELRDVWEMMNGMKGCWRNIIPAGGFMLMWPGQVLAMEPTSKAPIGKSFAVPTMPAPPSTLTKEQEQLGVNFLKPPVNIPVVKKERKTTYMQTPRYSFLCALGIDALYEEAKKAGIINPSGTKKQIVHLVARTEFEAQKQAA